MALRILLVDDHHEFRRHARRLLELEGLEIVGEAADAASALESARLLRPDVVLLDVGLPDMSGLQIVDRLCPPGSPGPAIVLISTHTARDLGPLLRRSNARGFIAKHELSGSRIEALAR
jgi:DNA-binding NarL/FixJ family response regulator